MTDAKKQKWIAAEHNKAVKIHHANIDRIKELEEKINTNLYRIHYHHYSYIKLDRQEKFDRYEMTMDLIIDEEIKLVLEIAQYKKDIDSHSKEDSWKICQKNMDHAMLSKKYDKLFPKEVKK